MVADAMSYTEAMESYFRLKWRNTIHEELSGISKKVVLSEVPNGFLSIGTKWVFQRWLNTDGTEIDEKPV